MLVILCLLLIGRPFISPLVYPIGNAWFTALFLALLLAWLIRRRPLAEPAVRPLLLPAAAFVCTLVIPSLLAPDKIKSAMELFRYFSGVMLFIIILSLKQEEKETVIKAVLFSALAISVCALYQFFCGFSRLAEYVAHAGNGYDQARDYINAGRVFFPFVTPNLLAGYLAMTLPLAFYFKRTSVIALPIAVALLLTRSLGAMASVALGILFFLLASRGKTRRVTFYLLCALAVTMTLVFLVRMGRGAHTLPVFSSIMRIHYWQETLGIIRSSPLTGIGLGNFNLVYSRYAHNSYLQLAAEAGIFALAAFVWLAVIALRQIRLRKDEREPDRRLMITAAALIFLAHNLVDFSFFLPEIASLWWVILGL
jgi:putative inorganic carbon (hco3(-)) transporter